MDGAYFGPTSGISFLKRAWQRLCQDRCSSTLESREINGPPALSTSKNHDSGSSPCTLPFPELPTWTDATTLTARYFGFAMSTYRILHHGTVNDWLLEMYQSDGCPSGSISNVQKARKAVILMIFATSSMYTTNADGRIVDATESSYQQR